MIPQIDVSLTEFTWNFRELKFAIPQGNYADYVRIADYIELLKVSSILFEFLRNSGYLTGHIRHYSIAASFGVVVYSPMHMYMYMYGYYLKYHLST